MVAAMSLRRYNPRRDGNEPAIVRALQARGFSVVRVSGSGVPDLLVGYRNAVDSFGNPEPRMWLVEVKQPKGRMKPAQIKFRESWTGPPPITIRSVEEALLFPMTSQTPGAHA